MTRKQQEISSDVVEGYNRTFGNPRQVMWSLFPNNNFQKAVHVRLSRLLTLANQDNQWKVWTFCTFGLGALLVNTNLVEIYTG